MPPPEEPADSGQADYYDNNDRQQRKYPQPPARLATSCWLITGTGLNVNNNSFGHGFTRTNTDLGLFHRFDARIQTSLGETDTNFVARADGPRVAQRFAGRVLRDRVATL